MKYLTEKEEHLLLKTVRGRKGKQAERDYIIMLIGFNVGLRCSEIVGLNVSDVRGKEKLYVRPEIAKRAVARDVPLNKRIQTALRTLIKLKLKWREGIQDDAPLLVSKKKGRLSDRSLQELFEFWCKESGLTYWQKGKEKALYHVHSMRHSYAKRLLDRGVPLPVVQKLLGHKSLASTGIYLEASWEEMEDAVASL